VGTDPAAMFPDKLRLVSRVPSLSAVPANRIHLGDIAVTGGGSVYLENLAANTWATVGYTPSGPMETMDLIKIPENNPVYAIPAQIYRWRDMDH